MTASGVSPSTAQPNFIPVESNGIRLVKNTAALVKLVIETCAAYNRCAGQVNFKSEEATRQHNHAQMRDFQANMAPVIEDIDALSLPEIETYKGSLESAIAQYRAAMGAGASLDGMLPAVEEVQEKLRQTAQARRAQTLAVATSQAQDQMVVESQAQWGAAQAQAAAAQQGSHALAWALEEAQIAGQQRDEARSQAAHRQASQNVEASLGLSQPHAQQATHATLARQERGRVAASSSRARPARARASSVQGTGHMAAAVSPPRLSQALQRSSIDSLSYAFYCSLKEGAADLLPVPSATHHLDGVGASESLADMVCAIRNPIQANESARYAAANRLLARLHRQEPVMQALAMIVAYADLAPSPQQRLCLRVEGSMFGAPSGVRMTAHYQVTASCNDHDCKAILMRDDVGLSRRSAAPSMILFQGTQPESLHGLVADLDRTGVGGRAFQLNQTRLDGWVDGELREGRKVQMMGHSLGAALALRLYQHTQVRLQAFAVDRTEAWLFSSPGLLRGHDDKTARRELDPHIHAFWHEGDIVKTCGNVRPPCLLIEVVHDDLPFPIGPHLVPSLVLVELGQVATDRQVLWRRRDLVQAAQPWHEHFNISHMTHSTGAEIFERVMGWGDLLAPVFGAT